MTTADSVLQDSSGGNARIACECGSECLAFQGYGHHVTCKRVEMVPREDGMDARKFYVHPRSREWAEGYIEAKGWRDVTLVDDYHVEPRRLELFPCAPTPVEHLKPIAALLRGAPDVG